MKIDCPHCGVHGSIDDSLAGKTLRCPKCSKVFLVADDLLLEDDDSNLPWQEILDELEPGVQDIALEELEQEEELEPATVTAEELEQEEELEPAAVVAEELKKEEKLEPEAVVAEELEEEQDIQEILTETEVDEEDISEEEGLTLDSEETEAVEDENDSTPESENLETCDGCGESLHPEFLETVEEQRLCALCLPEDDEAPPGLADDEVELDSIRGTEEHSGIAQTLMADQAADDGEPDVEDSQQKVCSGCGDTFHKDFLQEVDSKFYCGLCQPDVVESATDEEQPATDDSESVVEEDEEGLQVNDVDFTVGELIKEAWQKTRGTKASIWGGTIFMYLVLFGLSFAGVYLSQGMSAQGSPSTTAVSINGGLQIIISWLSMLFTGGLMLIGVRRALEQRVTWKMVFAGFSGSKILSLTIAVVLQIVLVVIGFILLVLPGIYLAVGYGLSLPLILDKGLGPWEALETSRKAIHKKWWTVLGMYLVMMLLYIVSAIPLCLGLIWTVPMFFVLVGVLYARFFGSPAIVEEDEEGVDKEEIEETNEADEEPEEKVEEVEKEADQDREAEEETEGESEKPL